MGQRRFRVRVRQYGHVSVIPQIVGRRRVHFDRDSVCCHSHSPFPTQTLQRTVSCIMPRRSERVGSQQAARACASPAQDPVQQVVVPIRSDSNVDAKTNRTTITSRNKRRKRGSLQSMLNMPLDILVEVSLFALPKLLESQLHN